MTSWTHSEAAVLAVAPTMRVTAGIDPPMSPTGRRSAETGMVVVDGELYARGVTWVRLAIAQRRGWIRTGTLDRAVTFSVHNGPTDAIDAAYHAKYGDHGDLTTRGTTLRINPA